MAGGLPIKRQTQFLLALLIATAVLPAFATVLPASAKNQGVWTSMASMPTARGGFGVAVVNGKIYAIGGLNGDAPLNVVEEYNPATNQWTTKTPMPTARSGFAIAVYKNQIYVIGGTVGSGYIGNNEVYDPATNTWQTKTSMPTPRADLCASVVGDKIYLIGGKKYDSKSPFYKETDINEVYDPVNNSWSTGPAMTMGVQGYSSAVLNDKIFIIGGSREPISIGNTIITDANQVFNPKTGEWNMSAQLPNVNSYGAAAATEGYMVPQRIFYIGGFSSGEFTGLNRVYFPENNSWNIAEPMPTARAYLSIAVVDDILYAIGGFDGTNWLKVNEQYKPADYGTVAPKVQITSPENKTYTKLSLSFTVNRATEWMAYSLDNQANVTIQGPIELVGIPQGDHSIVIYANDSLGNMGSSNTVYFSIDTIGPDITIITPKNQSYDSTNIQLSFITNENVTYLAYSLDCLEEVPILGNVTLLALSEGAHRLTVYATDEMGNVAEKTVYFSVALFPTIAVVATVTLLTIVFAAGFLFFKRRKASNKKAVQASNSS
jgi:N-acetylneuraminic acid mutarotase